MFMWFSGCLWKQMQAITFNATMSACKKGMVLLKRGQRKEKARGSQGEPGGARGKPGEPGGARESQGEPEGDCTCFQKQQKNLKFSTGTQGQPGPRLACIPFNPAALNRPCNLCYQGANILAKGLSGPMPLLGSTWSNAFARVYLVQCFCWGLLGPMLLLAPTWSIHLVRYFC